jgi:hypothetical protein
MNVHAIMHQSRGLDVWGDGAFAASRGGRLHIGRDYRYAVGEGFETPMAGKVMRIGYPYASHPEYRLIELLTDERTILWRFFYLDPAPGIKQNAQVTAGQLIGYAQNLSKKYEAGMTNHIHVECIVDPQWFFNQLPSLRRGPTWV